MVTDAPETNGIRHILVAVDGSEPAAWAVQVAAELAGPLGARIGLVHVAGVPAGLTPGYGLVRQDLSTQLREAGQELLESLPLPLPPGVPVERMLRQGLPADGILAAAREWPADLIVIGTHGRAGIPRLLLGSTAESVLRRAECPVLCVSRDPSRRRDRQLSGRADVTDAQHAQFEYASR